MPLSDVASDTSIGFTLVVTLVFAPLLVFFWYLIRKRDSLLEAEKTLTPIYSENCGARFGSMNLTIPLVRFAIYDEFIVLSSLKTALLKYAEIDRVEFKRQLFSKGIRIRHHRSDVPPMLVIWSRSGQTATDLIRSKLGMSSGVES